MRHDQPRRETSFLEVLTRDISWNSPYVRAVGYVVGIILFVYLTGGPMLIVYLLRGKLVGHSTVPEATGGAVVQIGSWITSGVIAAAFVTVYYDSIRMLRSQRAPHVGVGKFLVTFMTVVTLITLLALPRQMIMIGPPPRTVPVWNEPANPSPPTSKIGMDPPSSTMNEQRSQMDR